MSTPIRTSVALCAITLLGACAPQGADRAVMLSAAGDPAAAENGPNKISLAQSDGAAARPSRFVAGELLVKMRGTASNVDVVASKLGISMQSKRSFRSVAGLHLVKLDAAVPVEEAVATLRGQADVEYAEPNYIYRQQSAPNDPAFAQQWALDNVGQTQGVADADIDAREAWDISTGSGSTVVAVIDSGVDYTHPDLAANIYTSADCDNDGVDDDANGYVDDCHGIDTADDDSDPMDTGGHGTHVAGIIAARGNNGVGVSGVAWNARIVACRFIGADGDGNTADAVACLDYVAALRDRGVNVVATNNSWGGGPASRALQDAIERQRQRGILFVTAAGNARSITEDHNLGINDYLFESGGFFPCAYRVPNVICVSASTDHDDLEPYSYYGVYIGHVFAPGGDILSTLPGGTYGLLSGTSMAAPHVTGVIALLKSATPSMGWLEARNRILAGGDTITRDARFPDLGWPAISQRRLNARGALTCTSGSVLRRTEPGLQYPRDDYAIGQPMTLSVLHVNCTGAAGAVAVTINPGNVALPLHDDGLDGDRYAGDGEYSATWTPTVAGQFTLVFPGIVNRDAGQGPGPDEFVVNVHPFLKRGFPTLALQSAGQVLNPPETFLANLDGGNDVEIVDSSVANGPTYAWKSDGTPLPGWPLSRGGRMYHVGYYSAGEMDGNPATLELAGSSADDGTNVPSDTMLGDPIEAFSVNGQMLSGWPRASLNYIRTPPVMVDFDLDGREDMILGGGDGYLRGLRYDAESLPGFFYGQQPSTGNQNVMTPLAGDLDGDGRPELILTSSGPGRTVLSVINGASGTAVRREVDILESMVLFAVGDVDGDGTMNILGYNHHGDGQGNSWPLVSVLAADGTVLRQIRTSPGFRSLRGTALADLDQDGIPEIVLSQSLFDGYWQTSLLEVTAIRGDGSTMPGFPVVLKAAAPTITAVPTMTAPVVGDVDGDGRPEIIVNADGDLFVINHDGTNAAGTPFRLPRPFWIYQSNLPVTPAIADLDGDGRNDIVVTSDLWDGRSGWFPEIYAFDLRGPANRGPIEWGQPREAAHRRAAYITGKNLVADAFLAIQTQGDGRVTSTTPAFQCQDHCLRKYAKNSTVRITAAPTSGGTFAGWRGACAGQGATCQLTLSAFATTSAVFSAKTLAVTVTGPGKVVSDVAGIQCPPNCSADYTSAQTVTLTATADSNASFIGWTGACTGSAATCTVSMSAARSVGARFEYLRQLDVGVVSFNGAGGSITLEPGNQTCTSGTCSYLFPWGTHVRLTANAVGSDAILWSGACSGSQPVCEFDMTEQRYAYAEFLSPVNVSVSKAGAGHGKVTSTPAGIDCGATCSATFPSRTSIRFVATPDADSAFTGWSGSCDGPNFGEGPGECWATAFPNFSTVATFVLKQRLQVTLDGLGTVTGDVAGIDCGTTCSALYAPSTRVRLTANAGPESRFVEWTGDCSGPAINDCVLDMNQAHSVTAHFVYWPTLTFSTSGSGSIRSEDGRIDCGTRCSARFAPGDYPRFTAVPAAGFYFVGWGGACQTSGPISAQCTIAVGGPASATATFARSPELTITRSGSGSGRVTSIPAGIDCGSTCKIRLDPGTPISLLAEPGSNSEFAGWTGACTSTANSCTFQVTADGTVNASFRELKSTTPPPPVPPPLGAGGGRIDWWLLALCGGLVLARRRKERVGL